MKRRPVSAAVLLVLASSAACSAPGGSSALPIYVINVAAGDFERRSTPVSFEMPASVAAAAGSYHLRDPDGKRVPLQVDVSGRGYFILDHLAANGTASLTLHRGGEESSGVEARRESGAVVYSIAGQPILTYNGEITRPPRPEIEPVYARGGYIHPLVSPQGVVVTGDYPPDHVHHHGVWASWTRTRFEGAEVDFWNVADRKGDVVPVALDTVWEGQVHGGFSARHRYVALTAGQPKDALNERWTARIFNIKGGEEPYWLFDLEIEQETATASRLELPTYHYGGVAFRGRADWYGTPNASFLTSEGHDRESGNETRARWTHISGSAQGGTRGVGVLSHPDNFRHPEPVRIHPNEPYFVWTPSQLGDWAIEPGNHHRVRYRYMVHDGAADPAELDRIWNDFAYPPVVTVEAP